MNLEERVARLETLVNALVESRAMDKQYTNADINGTRQSVANITPYTKTKKAYYGENEKTFYNVPRGDVSVFFSNYHGDYDANVLIKSEDLTDIIITFPTSLNADTDITVSITRYYQI